MKLVSWNVNGIRSIVTKGFYEFIERTDPDIICLQETKASPSQIELVLPDYKYQYWDTAEKRGYSGTAVFSKIEPINFTGGMDKPHHSTEGRICTLEFEKFILVNVYVPNSRRGLERLPYRQTEWDVDFLKHIRKLEQKKPVVFCGDLNVAHKEIDLANPKTNTKNAGFTPEERAGFDNIVNAGFVDTFREFTSEGGHYTWWSYMGGARERNIGWRIDYFCVSKKLMPLVKKSYIMPDVKGSDHAPVVLEADLG
jgi:exodeoxyribonuclease-3